MTTRIRGRFFTLASAVILAGACSEGPTASNAPVTVLKGTACTGGTSVSLAIAQTTRVDCTNGGTTTTLAGNGASYLIVPQFATDQLADQFYPYNVATGKLPTASISAALMPRARLRFGGATLGANAGLLPARRPGAAQLAAERVLRARAAQRSGAGAFRASMLLKPGGPGAVVLPPPALGTLRSFRVASSISTATWQSVGAKVAYVGTNVLVYVDTLAPGGGLTASQLASFAGSLDQTLYPIDTAAFGSPTDIDNNGRLIVVMSPVVNADAPKPGCQTSGPVLGFFDAGDFDGASNTNSNHGEIFYSVVPDPSAVFSCAILATDVTTYVPGSFMHEVQHLISYAQHVVIGGGSPVSGWMDEGLSLVAEELGSLYYEQKCPPPACRTNAASIFPDSSLGFINNFPYDSYQYALVPDTASLTLHSAGGDNDYAWRGGDWLLMRWLADQYGTSVFRAMEKGPANGVANVEHATGQTFPSLFANFGLALYTDSLPGLARTTAPPVNRFTTRNMPKLWSAVFATYGPASDVPFTNPVGLYPVTADTSSAVLVPGTMTYFRLDTPSTAATVTIQFSAPAGAALAAALHPQVAIFRLPAGQ